MDVLSFTQFVTESAYGELDVAKSIITTLRKGGFQAYLVGGCVRDTLLNRKPKDYDVATDAKPVEVLKIFPEADKVGAHFGVVIEKGVEIATFRSDGAYGDARRPDSVQFEKSPREDAARRDFTVNAMFMDPFSGHVIDFFGGQHDIKAKVLRAVGDPYKRFGEDHLRMLRAMRFAAKLGFTIESETLAAMKGLAPHIKGVSVERVTQEITGALAFPQGPLKSFNILKSTGMLGHLIPELDKLPPHQHDILLSVLGQIGHESHMFALAAFFCQLDLKTVEKVAKRLKLSNDEQRYIYGVLGLQVRIAAVDPRTTMDVLKRLMREPNFADALNLYGMRMRAGDPYAPHHVINPHELLSKMYTGMRQEDLHPEKFVTGEDLIRLGLRPGPEFKGILDHIENAQLRGDVKSKAEALALVAHVRKS